jgi:cytochrome P450
MATRFNPFDPDFIRDPYPIYAKLREEAPVIRVKLSARQLVGMFAGIFRMIRRQGMLNPSNAIRFFRMRRRHRKSLPAVENRPGMRTRIYAVASHPDVSHVLCSPDFFSSEIMGGSQPDIMNSEGDIAPTSGALIAHDPPEHTRQRRIVNRGFTPRRIAGLESQIRKNAEELFTGLEAGGTCDLMAQFANPLPVSVIADLLGLDPARRDDFKRWSTALIVGSTQPGEGYGGHVQLFREFRSYMSQVIESRRKSPGEDLISTLIHAGEDEGILSTDQVISFATLLLAAGSETTTNVIGNALLALFEHPDQLAQVQRDPGLIPQLVEETLRYDPPIQLTMRIATRASEVGGITIPKGSIVAVLIGSANRDEAIFDEPERFDISRPNAKEHLGFGFGNHYCIGASLARLEATIALEMILGRLEGLELAGGLTPREIERHGSFLVRGPTSLPIRFSAKLAQHGP